MPRIDTRSLFRSLTSPRARAGLSALAIAGIAAGVTAFFMWLAASPGGAQQLFVRFRTNQPIALSVGDAPGFQAFTLADVDGDGKPDLIAVDDPNTNVNVLLGNGDGTFQNPVAYEAPDGPVSVAVADVSSPFASSTQGRPDNKPDIIIGADDGTLRILLGRGDGTFDPFEQDFDAVDGYDAGNASGLALADFDLNGTTDIAVFDDSDEVFFLCNNDGNFEACPTASVDTGGGGGGGIKILAGDFNADNYPDVAVLNQDSQDISVVFGKPGSPGSFDDVNPNLVSKLSEMGDGTPMDFIAGDLDADGTTDLVAITDSVSSDLPSVILLGRRRGTLDATFFGTDPSAMVMGLGDFDASGTIDLLTLDQAGPSFFAGDGTGGFAQGFAVSAPGLTRGRVMAVANIGGDSLPDFVVLANDNAHVQVAINLRNATPGPTDTPGTPTPGSPTVTRSAGPTNTPTIPPPTTTLTATTTATPVPTADYGRCNVPLRAGASLTGIATGPFDGDRFPDIAVTDATNNAVYVVRNNSAVQQQLVNCARGSTEQTVDFTQIAVGPQPSAIAAIDIPPYGSVDLVVAESDGIVIIRNDGQGNFGAPESPIAAGANPVAIAADYPIGANGGRDRLDLNRDTLPDFVVADKGSETLYIFYGRSDGGFDVQPYPIVGNADRVVAADFDQDGEIDLVLGRGISDPLVLIQQRLDANQHAQFQLSMFGDDDPLAGNQVMALASGFLNGDGFADLLMARAVGVAEVFLFSGGRFTRQPNGLATDGPPSAAGVGMFNRDGTIDVVAASRANQALAFGFGDGNGGFMRPESFALGAEPAALSVVNIDDQGMQDVVTANRDGSISVLLSSAPPPTLTPTITPTFTPSGTPTITGTITETGTPTATPTASSAGTLTFTPTSSRTATPPPEPTLKPGTFHLSSCSIGDPPGRPPTDVFAVLALLAFGSWWRRRSVAAPRELRAAVSAAETTERRR